jgi:hypothetical protein
VFRELWLDLKREICHKSGQVTQFVTGQLSSGHSICRQSVKIKGFNAHTDQT